MWSSLIQECQAAESIPGIITCQNAALALPLLFDPGERWEYGINIDWVGKIVERVSGQTLDRYLEQNILGPLGMKDTAFKITPSMRARLVPIHQRGEDGSLQPTSTELPQDPEFLMGGGGLYGTATDYLNFTQMILHRGTYKGAKVLRPETVALMSQNHIGDIHVGVMKTAAPFLSRDVILYPGMPLKWGLSFLINTAQTPEGRSAGSLAWAGLANTFFWIDPTKKITGVFLTQVLPFFDQKAIKLFSDFEFAVYRSL
jgi:methyl acetate hydrolase